MKHTRILATVLFLAGCATAANWQSVKYAGSNLDYSYKQAENGVYELYIRDTSFKGSAGDLARAVDTAQQDLANRKCGQNGKKPLIMEDAMKNNQFYLLFRCI